jgi:putative acetyltransferase
MKVNIRNEKESDYQAVEDMTRKAFYNLYVPGCIEHYLVHIMREHEDFIPELALVIERDGRVIANIMYTKAKLIDMDKNEKQVLTFGPISVLPEYQRQGYGKMLMEYSFEKAVSMGYDTVVIFGNPGNYVGRGFKSCKKYDVCLEEEKYPAAMLVKELRTGVLDGRKWTYCGSPVMNIDEEKARLFDESLERLQEETRPSQEEFYILSNSFL